MKSKFNRKNELGSACLMHCHYKMPPGSLQSGGEPFVSLLSVQVALMHTGGNFANITPMGREVKTREN